ncbi:dihydrolipoamide acetyltransferase family protein [Polycladomyces subterraneus]|uniref:Dihydrolipoamide acetyltransferase component of pyruvate dehydrogenase complex n=1 Tax=Polycladomyces subterraneus TaxID=1016997 RepID=A0ABT8IMV8_9BACL|nr:dihydrolipoamide acetyltransferase family protein [Polycladomyces subterraneus]MDN4593866.1 2-oxo acid dehydrogenase subunit E2 [Polycladomyces subterraneus]
MAETIEVRLPETTPDVTESLVVFWHRMEGDWVEKGEVLLEIQTEKAVFEVEAPADGRLTKILVKRGEVAAVGDVLAIIEPVSGALSAQQVDDGETAEQAAEQVAATVTTQKADPVSPLSVKASPRIRQMAKEMGVDLATVVGTGPGGRITEDDVRNAANRVNVAAPGDESTSGSSSDGDIAELTAVRRTIAKRMVQSLQQSAQLTITAWADVTELAEQRKQLESPVSWTTLILRAVVLALREHPYMNATWGEQGILQFRHVHLGVAVDTEHGLLVPVIRNAEQFSLSDLQEIVNQAIKKAKEGKLSAEELSGSTFTVSNLGAYGIQFFTPILNPPEAAILGVGQIEPRTVLEEERLTLRERLPLSLTFDHRVTDGAPAARFLQSVVQFLRNPDTLF